jgi:Ca-activated chloride channel family protein
MTLLNPGFAEIGLAVTALVLLGLWGHSRRRRRLAEFLGGRRAADRASRSNLYRLRFERMALLGLGGLAVALASGEPRPRTPAPEEPSPPPRSVVIAIDVSASMQATDVAPTRLAGAVEVAGSLVDALGEDRVGLLLFAGSGYPLAPPTYDHGALHFLLGGVAPTIASALDPGTLLSVGIREGTALVERPVGSDEGTEGLPSPVAVAGEARDEPPGDFALVILGDGESGEPEGDLMQSVAAARSAGVTIYTVGLGTPEGAGMVMPEGRYQIGGPVVDEGGGRSVSRLRESVLRDVAEQGGGRYALATNEGGLAALTAELAEPVTAPQPSPGNEPFWGDYDLPVVLGAAALVLIVLESLLDVSTSRAAPRRIQREAA